MRTRHLLWLALPLCLGLTGCFAGQKKQLASCEASASRSGAGQPLRSIIACMDTQGYRFVGYANPGGLTVVCDLPSVIRGVASADGSSDAKCFEPKGDLALRLYHFEVPDRTPG